MTVSKLPAIHPGEILQELYLEPLDMTPYALAKHINVPRTRVERIISEKTGITTDTAMRLAKFFKTAPEFWLNLQNAYDIKIAARVMENDLAQIKELEPA
ncbi:HigA family addiction module antitoxin [Rhizobium miluonense]|uniref:Addiction module antidote protein, HigA family n=1 Tax=Rhizobium miluonense TaxID=411945 RepID=A0A1C3WML5_9HYPH|nr:HigA family addiction module antitoxin [Rhizobium miluonense]SCB41219.1 addiction module antidote protein, HigA family [Rhizobium miluonense]